MSEEAAYFLQTLHAELKKLGAGIVGQLELRDDVLATYNGQMLLQADVHSDPGYDAGVAPAAIERALQQVRPHVAVRKAQRERSGKKWWRF